LNALLLAAKDKDIIHIDECHELAKPYQTALYRAIDKREIVLSGSGKPGSTPQSIPLGDFTLLLSTTDEYNLLQPLRDRMRLLLRFDFYSNEDLTTVLLQRSRALRWEIEEQVLPLIAQRARGTPRLALRLLQSCRRVCRAGGETTITTEHLERACALEQIDDLGLGPVEQRYLKIVANGASRLNVIASMLGLPSKTVSEVVEPFLVRSNFLVKDDQGRRQITADAREHLLNRSKDPI
jgi:Holliday junction DNA helicase RuvB